MENENENENGKRVIFTGGHGLIVAHHPDDEDPLDAKWSHGPVEQCRLRYNLPKREQNATKAWSRSTAQSDRGPTDEIHAKETDEPSGTAAAQKPVR
jgi:hypothetical protein